MKFFVFFAFLGAVPSFSQPVSAPGFFYEDVCNAKQNPTDEVFRKKEMIRAVKLLTGKQITYSSDLSHQQLKLGLQTVFNAATKIAINDKAFRQIKITFQNESMNSDALSQTLYVPYSTDENTLASVFNGALTLKQFHQKLGQVSILQKEIESNLPLDLPSKSMLRHSDEQISCYQEVLQRLMEINPHHLKNSCRRDVTILYISEPRIINNSLVVHCNHSPLINLEQLLNDAPGCEKQNQSPVEKKKDQTQINIQIHALIEKIQNLTGKEILYGTGFLSEDLLPPSPQETLDALQNLEQVLFQMPNHEATLRHLNFSYVQKIKIKTNAFQNGLVRAPNHQSSRTLDISAMQSPEEIEKNIASLLSAQEYGNLQLAFHHLKRLIENNTAYKIEVTDSLPIQQAVIALESLKNVLMCNNLDQKYFKRIQVGLSNGPINRQTDEIQIDFRLTQTEMMKFISQARNRK